MTASAPAPARVRPALVPDLVYDVGMHRGEDTVYYLRKGYRVVAFEAQPAIVEAARARFAAAIDDGRLRIVSGAITSTASETVTFYTHSKLSGWGTAAADRASRNDVFGHSGETTVPAVDFRRCLAEHGVPHFLKIDIEGADMLCLEALLDADPDECPRYVSIEAESESWAGAAAQFDLLERLGYSRYAIVQQGDVGGRVGPIVTRDGRRIPFRFEWFSSGPFGDDLAEPWLDKTEAMRRYRRILPALVAAHAFDRLPRGTEVRYFVSALVGRPLPGWFDIHAAR
jgi:FkbM family methyltransferase